VVGEGLPIGGAPEAELTGAISDLSAGVLEALLHFSIAAAYGTRLSIRFRSRSAAQSGDQRARCNGGAWQAYYRSRNAFLDDAYATRHAEVTRASISRSPTEAAASLPMLIEHLFEPFFTTKPVGECTSLSMVYGFVKQSGGILKDLRRARSGHHSATVSSAIPRG